MGQATWSVFAEQQRRKDLEKSDLEKQVEADDLKGTFYHRAGQHPTPSHGSESGTPKGGGSCSPGWILWVGAGAVGLVLAALVVVIVSRFPL